MERIEGKYFVITLDQDCTYYEATMFKDNLTLAGGQVVNENKLEKSFDVRLPPGGLEDLDESFVRHIHNIEPKKGSRDILSHER